MKMLSRKRRHPAVFLILLFTALLVTGGIYAAATTIIGSSL